VHEGEKIVYTFTVENTGSQPLTNVVVNDNKCAPTWGPSTTPPPTYTAPTDPTTLNPGSKWYYKCELTVPPGSGDTIENHATASGHPPEGPDAHASAMEETTVYHPNFMIKKYGPSFVTADSAFDWTIEVTNTGNAPETVYLRDTYCTLKKTATKELLPGESETIICDDTARDDGTVIEQNVVCAYAVDTLANSHSRFPASSQYDPCAYAQTVVLHPRLDVTKTVDKPGAVDGDLLTYTVTVKNTGDVILLVTPDDPGCDDFKLSPAQVSLGPNATFTFQCTHVYDAEGDGHTYVNEACADGIVEIAKIPGLNGASYAGAALLAVDPTPDASDCGKATTKLAEITLTKSLTNGFDMAHMGDTVEFHFVVENTGEADLWDVFVTDAKCNPGTLRGPYENGHVPRPTSTGIYPIPGDPLKPGHKWDFYCLFDVPMNPKLFLELTNHADAEGTAQGGSRPHDDDEFTLKVIHPAMEIDKTDPEVGVAGEDILYTIRIRNTGDTDLEVKLTDTDPGCTPVSGPTGDPLPLPSDPEIHLDKPAPPQDVDDIPHPGPWQDYTCSRPAGTDTTPGQPSDTEVVNEACADAVDEVGGPKGMVHVCDTEHTPLVHPKLEVVKLVSESPTGPFKDVNSSPDGKKLYYQVTVTNIGDVELDVVAWDPACSNHKPSNLWANLDAPVKDNPATTGTDETRPGGSLVFTCDTVFSPKTDNSTYHPSDVSRTNKACAAGWVADGKADPRVDVHYGTNAAVFGTVHGEKDADACGTVTTWLDGDIDVVKSGPDRGHEGDEITYKYVVENTGEVPLDKVAVSDDKCPDANVSGPFINGTGTPGTPVAPGSLLQPGPVKWVFYCKWTIPNAHPDVPEAETPMFGVIHNTVDATALDPGKEEVRSTSEADVNVIHPTVELDKSGPEVALANEEILYFIKVRNIGDTDVRVKLEDIGCTPANGPSDTDPLPPASDETLLPAPTNTSSSDDVGEWFKFTCKKKAGTDTDPALPWEKNSTNTACVTGKDETGFASKNWVMVDNNGRLELKLQDCDTVVTELRHPQLKVVKKVSNKPTGPWVDENAVKGEKKADDEGPAEPGGTSWYQITITNVGDTELAMGAWDAGCGDKEIDGKPVSNIWKELDAPVPDDPAVAGDQSRPGGSLTFTCSQEMNFEGDNQSSDISYINKACAAGWVTDGIANPRPEDYPAITQALFVQGNHEKDAYDCNSVTTHILGEAQFEMTAERPPSEAEAPIAHQGDNIKWDFEIKNTGKQPLTNLAVKQEKCDPATIKGPIDESGALVADPENTPMPPGQKWEFECLDKVPAPYPTDPLCTIETAGVATPRPPQCTFYENEATFTADSPPGDGKLYEKAEWDINVLHPDFTIEKTPHQIIGVAGEEIQWKVKLVNTGDTALRIKLDDIGCFGLNKYVYLLPGAYWSDYCSTLPANDPGLPSDVAQSNTVTATGVDELGTPAGTVVKSSTATIKLVHPAVNVDKTVDETTADPGDTLHYHITVTNTGDIEMWVDANDYGCESNASIASSTGFSQLLDKGESKTFDCTHVFDPQKPETAYTNEACAEGRVDVNDAPDDSKYLAEGGKYDEVLAKDCDDATTDTAPHFVAGQVFEDMTANGQHDPGEPGLGGFLVYADKNNNGKHDGGEASSTSDSNGAYKVDVGLGKTTIREQPLPDFTCSFPTGCAYSADLPKNPGFSRVVVEATDRAADPSNVDFGNWAPASVSGTVFRDDNRNGLHEAAEQIIFGATVYNDPNGNGVLDAGEPSTTTAGNGTWTIGGLKPGTYAFRQVAITGLDCTFPSACAHTVTVVSRQAVTARDYLNAPPAGQIVAGIKVTKGTARLVGKTGCVNRRFTARVKGTNIANVTFLLDGYTIAGSRVSAVGEWSVRINPAKLKRGKHRIVAQVVFTSKSNTKKKTLRLTFQRCGKQIVAPLFTGGAGR
jgi:hypothetical protein